MQKMPFSSLLLPQERLSLGSTGCVVLGEVGPLSKQDATSLRDAAAEGTAHRSLASSKLRRTGALPGGGRQGRQEEPRPGTLLGEVTECRFPRTGPAQHLCSARGTGRNRIYSRAADVRPSTACLRGLVETPPATNTSQQKPPGSLLLSLLASLCPARGKHIWAGRSYPFSPRGPCAAAQTADREGTHCAQR